VNYEPEDLDVFRNVRKEIFTDAITPASTLVGVTSLALPAWLIEIDAVAVIEK
jgi:enamine deaminase RidA (YjgF/YER057c/UK114 family)